MDNNTISPAAPSVPPSSSQTPSNSSQSGTIYSSPPPPSGPSLQEEEKFHIPLLVRVVVGLFVLTGVILLIVYGIVPFFAKKPQVTITYWGLWEDSRTMQSIIADFERQNPSIHVLYEKQDPKKYGERILARVNNGLGPDILRFHNTWLPMLSSVLLPLPTDVIDRENFRTVFYPVATKDLLSRGAIYGIPFHIDTLSLFVNTSIFTAAGAKVPATWNDFISVARALTVKESDGTIKTAGAALGTFDNVTHAPDIISLLFLQNGVNMNDFKKTQQNASDALQFYTSFAKDKQNVWDSSLGSSLDEFTRGNVAMYFGYSWNIFSIKALNPTLSFAVYPVPHLSDRAMTVASYWADGISVKSKHQKESFTFLHYLLQKNTEEKLYTEEAKTRLFGELYARTDLGDTLKKSPLIYPFITQANVASSSWFVGEVGDTGITGQMNGYLGNAIRAILNDTSVDTSVNTLSQGVSQVLQQYGQQ